MDAELDLIAREVLDIIPVVMGTIRVEMRSRRGADLSVMQFRALVYLDMNPGNSLSALAEYLGLTLPTVSQMIDGLVEKGVVDRQDSSADRRRIMLSLTPQGNLLLEKARAGTQARLAELLSGLAPQDIHAVHQVMLLLGELFGQPLAMSAEASGEQPATQ